MAERRVPRIRFKGFEEDWEQRELGKFAAETRGGGTPIGMEIFLGYNPLI